MRFRHEDLNTDATFDCRMQCGQCNARTLIGRRCRNNVCIGRTYCHVHRRKKMGLAVRQSTIQGAGKGLFATRVFKKGSTIGTYAGELLSTQEHNRRYGESDQDHAPYSLRTSNSAGRVVSAECLRGIMSITNGTRYIREANARFVDRLRPDGTVHVEATRRIGPDTEVLVHYGRGYFDTAGNSKHTTS
jgi:hypothetical protein